MVNWIKKLILQPIMEISAGEMHQMSSNILLIPTANFLHFQHSFNLINLKNNNHESTCCQFN